LDTRSRVEGRLTGKTQGSHPLYYLLMVINLNRCPAELLYLKMQICAWRWYCQDRGFPMESHRQWLSVLMESGLCKCVYSQIIGHCHDPSAWHKVWHFPCWCHITDVSFWNSTQCQVPNHRPGCLTWHSVKMKSQVESGKVLPKSC
jgi:hypothetical protein